MSPEDAVIDAIERFRVAGKGLATALRRARKSVKLAVVTEHSGVERIERLDADQIEEIITACVRVSSRDTDELEGVLACRSDVVLGAMAHLNAAKDQLKAAVLGFRALPTQAFQTEFLEKSRRQGTIKALLQHAGAAHFALPRVYRHVVCIDEPVSRVGYSWTRSQFRIRKLDDDELRQLVEHYEDRGTGTLPGSVIPVRDALASGASQFRVIRPLGAQRRTVIRIESEPPRYKQIVTRGLIVLKGPALPEHIDQKLRLSNLDNTDTAPNPERYALVSAPLNLYRCL